MIPTTIAFAVLGGFVPAIIWLTFWLKEDEHPEPRRLLVMAFLSGILAIPLAFVMSWLWENEGLPRLIDITTVNWSNYNLYRLIGFAFAEEYSKYFLVHALIFWRRDYDEPVDAMIYLISTALGFAAVENVLYLIDPLINAAPHFEASIVEISVLRFIGATPLHALASGVLGYFIASSFFKTYMRKEIALVFGLVAATLLHTVFNLLILIASRPEAGAYAVEGGLLILSAVGIYILFAFEKVKHRIIS
ncbi:MAG TPA: PrsW family intramembrane metalloprotease [Candidatus Paceibacterota bacterium]